MSKTNDERILELRKQINEKEKEVGRVMPFSPITNCNLELDGMRYNLHAMTKEQLVSTMVKLQSYLISAKTLDVSDELTFSGYHVSNWIEDMQSKFLNFKKADELKKLKVMKNKLDELLSDGKRTELELDDIALMLK